jgi:hypothetical protein
MWFIPVLFVLIFVAFLGQELAPLVVSGILSAVPDNVWTMDVVARAMVMVVPLYFFSAAMTVNFPTMLGMAAVCGLSWDCAFTFPEGPDNDGVFGFSMLLFGFIGVVMQGVRPFFVRGRWEVPVAVIGVGIFLFMFLEFLLLSLSRAELHFPGQMWVKISVSTLMSMILAPVVFWMLYRLAAWTGYDLQGDTSSSLRGRRSR